MSNGFFFKLFMILYSTLQKLVFQKDKMLKQDERIEQAYDYLLFLSISYRFMNAPKSWMVR